MDLRSVEERALRCRVASGIRPNLETLRPIGHGMERIVTDLSTDGSAKRCVNSAHAPAATVLRCCH
jgi:hypothetical protein